MIQPLRTLHRRAFVALAFLLPTILLVGLGVRRPHPQAGVPSFQVPASVHLLKKQDGLWRQHAIQSQFYGDSSSPQDLYVVLQPAAELGEPDLLLYWTVGEPQGNSLPPQAWLLGSFAAGRAFTLPRDASFPGHLVLYSLAHQSVVDSAAVEKLP